MFPKGRKQTAVLTLVGLLMVSAPAARGGGGGGLPNQTAEVVREDRDREVFFSRAWDWIRSLWEKNGMCIDPDGRCAQGGTVSPPSQIDHGPCIDPNGGGCVASSSS